jgi:hypothetical protein
LQFSITDLGFQFQDPSILSAPPFGVKVRLKMSSKCAPSIGVNIVGPARVTGPFQDISTISLLFLAGNHLVIKRGSINSIAAVWAADSNNVAVKRKAVFAFNLLLPSIDP